MADIIKLLPDHVANQIAAGEVVQRPASVVKELMENAIDAKATKIQLVVKDAGKTLIQVIDNGVGMSTTDARLSFSRHATSKIQSADDLFNLNTKGFRGEAMASIAAIAHVDLRTRTEKDEIGTRIVIEGSEVVSQDPVVTPQGTAISVKNLFYNIPARRNFLKSKAVETRHIIDEFHRVALAHPGVQFSMLQDDNPVFELPSTTLRKRIVNIFGSKTNEKLVPVEEETEIVSVSGFVLKPQFAKKSRGEQFFFVNDRFIKSPYLHHAVTSAFEGLIKDGTYPGYFLFLTVDPHSIDINIHPTKTEIKFDDEHSIYALLRSTIKHGLGQFSVAPILDFNKDSSFDTPYAYSKKNPVIPAVEVDRDFNPFASGSGSLQTHSVRAKAGGKVQWEALYEGLKDVSRVGTEGKELQEIEFESEEVSGNLFDTAEENIAFSSFQFQNKYIICPMKNALMLIHQNQAHQRVLYEEFLRNITVKEAVSQQLLFPLEMSFSAPELSLLKSIQEQLEFTGFVFRNWANDTVTIEGVPVGVDEKKLESLLQQLIHEIENEVPDPGFSQNDLLARSMAKSMAIRTGEPLKPEACEHLINQLFACKEPHISPDNSPAIVTLGRNDLDKYFN